MAHIEMFDFFKSVEKKYPEFFTGSKMLDCGSCEYPNTCNQHKFYMNAMHELFEKNDYTGLDMRAGKYVDVVSKIHEYDGPDESLDLVISTQVFEHDPTYKESLENMYRVLKPGGYVDFYMCFW